MDARPNPAVTALLGEAVMAALAEVSPERRGLVVPPGVPIRDGRMSVASLLDRLGGQLVAVSGFATACWVGPADATPPPLGRYPTTGRAHIVSKTRLFIDRRLRLWLDVADHQLFDAVVVPSPTSGIVLIPRERFCERMEALEW